MPQFWQLSASRFILNRENLLRKPEIQAIGQPNLWYWYIWLIFPFGMNPIRSSIIRPIGQIHLQNTLPNIAPVKTPAIRTDQREIWKWLTPRYREAPITDKITIRDFTRN